MILISRSAGRRLVRRVLRNAAIVLCYHRVANVAGDRHHLSVTPSRFAEHMDLVSRWGRFDVSAAFGKPRARPHGILVTFDDAYRDTLEYAGPILERYEVPALVFAPSALCSAQCLYWWEVLRRLACRTAPLPTDDVRRLSKAAGEWPRSSEGVPCTRIDADAWLELACVLRHLRYEKQRGFVEEALRVLGTSGQVDEGWPLSPAGLSRLAENRLVEIGAHTRTHPVLARLPDGEQREEMADGKRDLEEVLGRRIRFLAYPFGAYPTDFSDLTVSLARDVGFDAAFSLTPGIFQKKSDLHRVPRLAVHDWDGDHLERIICSWFGRP